MASGLAVLEKPERKMVLKETNPDNFKSQY